MRCLYCHNPDSWAGKGGMEMSADELLDKAQRYKSYWGKEGGITVSGGEADADRLSYGTIQES